MLIRNYNLKIPASLYQMVLTDKVKMSLFFKIKAHTLTFIYEKKAKGRLYQNGDYGYIRTALFMLYVAVSGLWMWW